MKSKTKKVRTISIAFVIFFIGSIGSVYFLNGNHQSNKKQSIIYTYSDKQERPSIFLLATDTQKGEVNQYEYEFLRTISDNKKPENSQLTFETDSGIYFVDSSNKAQIRKTADEGQTVTLIVDEGSFNIVAFYPDRTNNRLYYLSTRINSLDHIRHSHIDLSDDSNHFHGGIGYNHLRGHDICVYNNNYYFIITDKELATNHINVKVGSIIKQDMGDTTGRSFQISYITEVRGEFYFLWQWSNETVELWKYSVGTETFTKMKDFGANTQLLNINQRGIVYDGYNNISFFINDASDGKYYYYSYDINQDIFTKGNSYNVSLMLDRNTKGKSYPSMHEKGFDLDTSNIFQTWYGTRDFLPISNMSFDNKIIAITDNYMITENAELWKYTNRTPISMNNIVADSANKEIDFIFTEGPNDISAGSISDINLSYSYMTNVSQLINLDLFNFYSKSWDPVESSTRTDAYWTNSQSLINGEEYVNATGHIKIRISGTNLTSEFQLYLNYIKFNISYISQTPEIPFELIILITIISGGAMIGVATVLLIRRKRKRIQ